MSQDENEIYVSFYFTLEEVKDLMINLDQCLSEGYLNYGDPAYKAMCKFENTLKNYTQDEEIKYV